MTALRIHRGLVPPPADQRPYPLTDAEAWRLMGAEEAPHLFDRMWIAHSQGLEAHPHGIEPPPRVFSRPIYNLWGMGLGARLIEYWQDADYQPGHFWMPYLEGTHWSDDYVFEEGRCVFAYRVLCHKDANRCFVRFEGAAGEGPAHQSNIEWVKRNLGPYSGALNIETIGGTIIEVHLRPNTDFLTFYGQPFLDALAKLYTEGRWSPLRQPEDATVIPIRVAKAAYGNRFRVDQEALDQMQTALVALDFANDVPLLGEPDDGMTWRLALVGDANPDWADGAARHLAENIEPTDPPQKEPGA